jgi:hypothetical protein
MQTKNRATQVASLAIGLIVVAAGWAYANARRTNSSSKAEPSIALPSSCGSCLHHSGMLAIAALQTARLNVFNQSNPNETSPLILELRFYDDRGVVVTQTRVNLMPGQSGFLELSHRELGRSGRVPIRAEVVSFNPQPDPPGWVVTLEVYDNLTGRTALFLSDNDFVSIPPPDPE